jgi:hypothetical protein
LNPLHCRDADFAPTNDERFRFFWFPASYGRHVAYFELDHSALAGRHREIDASDLIRLRCQAVPPAKQLDQYAPFFDESYYSHQYEDVRHALSIGLQSGFLHYVKNGFIENRAPFELDLHWYLRTYPEAADAIGLGLFSDPLQHYVCVGARRGYKPKP